jgi:GNAT superfamily N-acetyltransferase
MTETYIRRATSADLPVLGRLGALLLRTHYGFDSLRFMTPPSSPEEGYAWFLGTQLQSDDVAVFVCERDGAVIGYVYAGIEPQSWKELRERAGFIHDVVVSERGRRTGVAAALIETAVDWLRSRGVPRVLLWTAMQNEGAQQLFTRLGFRQTMIEMTRELSRPAPGRSTPRVQD